MPAGGELRTREVGDGTSFHTQTDWIMAVLILGAAVAAFAYPVLKYDDPWVFDPYDPQFNPAIFVPVFLFVYGAKHLVTAMRGSLLRRRFGESVVHFDNTAVKPGGSAIDVIGEAVGEVRWILEVKAPLKGLNYYAIFGVHVVPASESGA